MKNKEINKIKLFLDNNVKEEYDKIKLYHDLSFKITNSLSNIRIKKLNFSFEKIYFVQNYFSKGNKRDYRGLLITEKEIKTFELLNEESILTSNQILKKAKEKAQDLVKIDNFLSKIELTNRKELMEIKKSVYSDKLYKKNGVNDIFLLERSYLNSLFKNQNNHKIFKKIVFNFYSDEIFKLSKKISGNYDLISAISKKMTEDSVSIDEIVKFYDEYPLLIQLYLKNINSLNKFEKKQSLKFYSCYKKTKSFIQNVKDYYDLTNTDLEKIKQLNWQTLTPFKNRPILALELLSMGTDLSQIKSRKEAETIYILYFYFLSNKRLQIKEDLLTLKDMEIQKHHYGLLKQQYKKLHDASKIEMFNYFKDNYYKIKITNLKETLTKIFICDVLKKDFYLKSKKIELKRKLNEFFVIIENKCMGSFSIEYIFKDRISFIYKKDNELIVKIIEKINNDYSKLFNKRYLELETINREEMFLFLKSFYKWEKVDKEMYDFIIYEKNINRTISRSVKDIKSLFNIKEEKVLDLSVLI